MRARDLLYFTAFTLLELVAAIEVTAMLVASPRIASILGIDSDHAGWILNSYLYPVFVVLLLLLIRDGNWVKRIFSARAIFITGLGLFVAGNLLSGCCSVPSLFFAGRIVQAVGGALAYLGQLWTAMVYFRQRLVTVMFWGECGLAIGIISGPMIGGYLVAWGESGWRTIFFFNAALALVTVAAGLAGLFSRQSDVASASVADNPANGGWREVYRLLAIQWAVMVAAVGGEYLLSNYYQFQEGLSARFVGWITSAASVGAVTGSALVASRPERTDGWLRLGLTALIAAIPVLGLCLVWLPPLWNVPILFVLGVGMGMASVSLYARIADAAPADGFFRVSILYLLAQQLGNAVGVQIEEAVAPLHSHPLAPAILLATPLFLAAVLTLRRKPAADAVSGTIPNA